MCLKQGHFPKLGKEESQEATNFRPISLLNIEGKILGQLMIYRINHHMYSNNLLNSNQYGFTPQKDTVDAAMAVKNFIQKNLNQKKTIIITSLDVKGVFNAA